LPDSTKFERVGTFVSKGIANGREVWKGPQGCLYHFSDGGSKISIPEKSQIKFDDLILKV